MSDRLHHPIRKVRQAVDVALKEAAVHCEHRGGHRHYGPGNPLLGKGLCEAQEGPQEPPPRKVREQVISEARRAADERAARLEAAWTSGQIL